MKTNPETVKAWQQRSQQRQRDNPKPRKRLRYVSQSQAARLKRYKAIRATFLEQHPFCVRCLADGIETPATDVHHVFGRDGDRLFDESNFLPVDRYCHEWLHAHPQEARALGWMQSRHRSSQEASSG